MKKIVVFLVIVGIAAIVYFKFIKTPPPVQVNPPVVEPSPPPPPVEEPPVKTDGIKLFHEGKYKDAAKQLEREVNDRPASEQPSVLNYLAQSYEKIPNKDKALETWQRLLKDYPGSVFCGNGYYALGKNESEPAKQMEYYEKALEKYPSSDGAKLAGLETGDYYLQLTSSSDLSEVDRLAKARKGFSLGLLKSDLSKEKKSTIKDKLNQINQKLVFSPMVNPSDSILYKVKKGDTLYNISNKHNVPAPSDTAGQECLGQIKRINHFKTSVIREDQPLKIITGKFRIEVDKSDFTLTLYLNNDYVKEYLVAVGNPKESPTPEGNFKVSLTKRLVNPPWQTPPDPITGKTELILFGDPRHIIGTRWIGFNENDKIGIHGTKDPLSLGRAITNGCIRMRNEDIEELFDLIPGGTEVTIQE